MTQSKPYIYSITGVLVAALAMACSSSSSAPTPSDNSTTGENYLQKAVIGADGNPTSIQTFVRRNGKYTPVSKTTASAGGATTESITVDCDSDPDSCFAETQSGCDGDIVVEGGQDCGYYNSGPTLCLTWDGNSPGYINLGGISYPGGGNWAGRVETIDFGMWGGPDVYFCSSGNGCTDAPSGGQCMQYGETTPYYWYSGYSLATCLCVSGYCGSCPD